LSDVFNGRTACVDGEQGTVVTAQFLDVALVDRARAGDRRALEDLLAACRPALVRYARRSCQSDDVEEAVQDALWILFRRLHGLRSAAAFASWLFQIVRRACFSYARRRRAHAGLDDIAPDALRDGHASDAELQAVLCSAIASLPPRYRDVLLLKDLQGYSADEAAGRLGISQEAARSRLHRARAILRDQLVNAAAGRDTGAR
jgi:RNA polymerase sigma factor (sigma-70 family)